VFKKGVQIIQLVKLVAAYSCFGKGCPTNCKVYATKPISIMGDNSLELFDWGSRCWARGKEKAWIHVFVLFPFLNAEIPWSSIKQLYNHCYPNTLRHCRVRLYAFVRQPFSKQLYKSPVHTIRRRNLKTVVSLWKRIKCFLSTLRLRNLKTQQSPVILDLCLRKYLAGKSHDHRDVIVFGKLRFQKSSV